MNDIQNDSDIERLVHAFYKKVEQAKETATKIASAFSVRVQMAGKLSDNE